MKSKDRSVALKECAHFRQDSTVRSELQIQERTICSKFPVLSQGSKKQPLPGGQATRPSPLDLLPVCNKSSSPSQEIIRTASCGFDAKALAIVWM
jgi:hypothetical protein